MATSEPDVIMAPSSGVSPSWIQCRVFESELARSLTTAILQMIKARWESRADVRSRIALRAGLPMKSTICRSKEK